MPKRANLKGPGRCIFCGSAGLSKEHIWSEWTYDLVPKMREGAHNKTVIQSSKYNPNIRGIEYSKNRQGSTNSIKLYVVCERHCNNGWMSQLEEAAKPILTPLLLGPPSVLSASSLRIIASWAVMKMMVTEFSRPHEVCSTQAERTFLMENQEPPSTWNLWIAHVRSDKWRMAYHRSSSLLGRLNDAGVPVAPAGSLAKNTQSITLGIGELLFTAISSTIPGIGFDTPTEVKRHIRKVWPIESGFLWPPGPSYKPPRQIDSPRA